MKSKILFLLLTMFLLNGLNNSRELNELAIVSAIGIDLDENNNYIITAQILNSKKENGSGTGSGNTKGSSEIVVLNSESDNVQTALRKIITQSPQKLYLAHMEMLLLSEKVAKEKEILDTLNFFIRDNEGSNNFMLVITKDCTPQEMLKINTPLESNPATNIKDSILVNHKYRGIATDNILSDNISMFKKESQTSVVTCITLSKNEGDNVNNKENIQISNLAFFKYKTLSGYLEENENYFYNIVVNHADGGILTIDKGDNLIVIEQISSKTKLVPRIENNNYYIDIYVDMIGNITETGKNIKFDSNKNIKDYEIKAQNYIKKNIENLIEKSKTTYDCDLFSFGNVFYKYKNKDYNNLKLKYGNDYYKHITTTITVTITLPAEGGIDNIW